MEALGRRLLPESCQDIGTNLELLGHGDRRPTTNSSHLLNRGLLGLRNPAHFFAYIRSDSVRGSIDRQGGGLASGQPRIRPHQLRHPQPGAQRSGSLLANVASARLLGQEAGDELLVLHRVVHGGAAGVRGGSAKASRSISGFELLNLIKTLLPEG